MKLHNYYYSSASFRVRIVLNLKGLSYDYVAHHLRKGEQREPDFLRLNPHGLVPALELDDGTILTQSNAIIEYLDEVHPEPPLLPKDALGRARVRALAQSVACDIHPLNNTRVLKYLETPLGHDQEARNAWYRHWIAVGFAALERELRDHPSTGRFCHGGAPGIADVFLVPQIFNAKRLDCDLSPYPTIRRILDACLEVPAFAEAVPLRQPDAEVPRQG